MFPPKPIPDYQRMNRMMEKEWRSHQSTLHCETAMIAIVINAQRRQNGKCSATNHNNGIGIVTETSL